MQLYLIQLNIAGTKILFFAGTKSKNLSPLLIYCASCAHGDLIVEVVCTPLHISLSAPTMSSLPPKIKLEEAIQKKAAPMPLIAFDDDSSISDSSVKAVNGMDVQDSSSKMMRGITSEFKNLPKKNDNAVAASSIPTGSPHVSAVKLEADTATDMNDAAVDQEIVHSTKNAVDMKEEDVAVEEKTADSEQGKKPKASTIRRDAAATVATAVPIYSLLSSDEDEDTDSGSTEMKEKGSLPRGLSFMPSGKLQVQVYYAGKTRYIGMFDSREKACLAYEISREVLKIGKGKGMTREQMVRLVKWFDLPFLL